MLDTHLHGQPRPLRGHPVQQPPGKPGPGTGRGRGQHGGGGVYLFAAQGVCGCVCFLSRPPQFCGRRAPPLRTSPSYGLTSLPINLLAFSTHFALPADRSHGKGPFLGTSMHVSNMQPNSASYRSITDSIISNVIWFITHIFLHTQVRPSRASECLSRGLAPQGAALCFLSFEACSC